MKKCILILLIAAVALTAKAQAPEKQFNRYGLPLVIKDGETWVWGENRIRKMYGVNPDTIPGWTEAYTYESTLEPGALNSCDVESHVYKEHAGYSCRMDVYLPENQGEGPFPYILFIHGGGWKNGHEKYLRNFAFYFASHGIASICVSYTLSGQGDFKAANQDLLDAKAFVEKHAAQWKIDPERFGFAGVSAGGHLSAFMAMTVPGTRVLISMCGPHDLTKYGDASGKLPAETAAYFGTTDKNLRKNSPIYCIPDNPPAAMLIHGTFDLVVAPEQSRRFAKALQEKGTQEVELVLVPYAPHAVVNPRVAGYEQSLFRMLQFAHKHLD